MVQERVPSRVRAILLALSVSACGTDAAPAAQRQPPPPLHVAVVGPVEKLRPADRVEGTPAAVLVAARNEFESFQVAVQAGDAPLRNVNVSLRGPLVREGGGEIPSAAVTVYRVAYLPVRTPSDLEGAPGPWPDALVPAVDTLVGEARAAFPVDVPPGENRVAWVDVLVPVGTEPGVYQGTLDVRADEGAAEVPLRVTVLRLQLPSTPTLKTSFGLSVRACPGLAGERCETQPGLAARLRARFVRLALDDRITLANPQATPVTAGSRDGLDEFRTVFLPFFDGTADTRLPGARLTTFQVNVHTDRNIAGWKAEVERDGLQDRAYVWSCDEPFFFPKHGDPAGNWKLCRARLEADRAVWPEAPKMVTAHIQTAEEAGTTGLIDIMTLNIELLHGRDDAIYLRGDQRPLYDAFLAGGARRRELWLYSACGSHGCTRNDDPATSGWAGGFQVDGPASQTRALGWLAFTYRLDGLLYYDTVMQLAHAWDDQYQFTGNGEGTLFYPGTPDRVGGSEPIPIESIRLKLLRDGLEDYEYLAFLRSHGRGDDAMRIARALFPAPFDTTRTDAQVQAARRELAAIAAGVTGGPAP
jgi:hypothetical protein